MSLDNVGNEMKPTDLDRYNRMIVAAICPSPKTWSTQNKRKLMESPTLST